MENLTRCDLQNEDRNQRPAQSFDSAPSVRPVTGDTLSPLPRRFSALLRMSNQKAAPRLTASAVTNQPMGNSGPAGGKPCQPIGSGLSSKALLRLIASSASSLVRDGSGAAGVPGGCS